MQFTGLDIVLITGAFQGIFLAIAFPSMKRANKQAHRIFSALLWCVSWVLIFMVMQKRIPSNWPIPLGFLMDTFPFLFGPLIYLYFRKLLFADAGFTKHVWIHFTPAIIHLIWVLYQFRFPNTILEESLKTGAYQSEWLIISFFLTAINFTYWLLSFQAIRQFEKKSDDAFSFDQQTLFLRVFLYSVLLCFVLWIFFMLNFFVQIEIPLITGNNIGWYIIPFLTYFIAYYAITKQEIFALPLHDNVKKSLQSYPEEELQRMKRVLEETMSARKVYLQPDLSLPELAKLVDSTPTRLSRIINELYQCNFYDFINTYRIKEFTTRVADHSHQKQTLLAIAYDSGFNSKSTFNKSFKKIMHDTPASYVRKQNVPVSTSD